MTSPATTLARATARGGQYQAWVAGGVKSFTAAEVGHALAGLKREGADFKALPDGAVRVLLCRYAGGDGRDELELTNDLHRDAGRAKTWAERAGWWVTCRAAVAEFLHARRCEQCLGRTTVMVDNQVCPCTACDATGYRPQNTQSRARALGLPFNTFKSGPAGVFYLGRLKRLVEWEEMGLRRVVGKTR